MILKTRLYEYQSKAVDKLSKLKVGALYMEQGTGKTRTALEIIKNKIDKGKAEVILWLCPCSVKNNLKEDIEKHTGDLPTENNIIIRGIESLSSSDRLYLQLLELVKNYKVYLIVDESNLVKNKLAIRTERIIEISSFCKYKMILNGTPISKNEADLFAQWYILDWRILGYKSFYSFAANHLEYKKVRLPSGREITTDQIIRVLNVDYLTEKIAPYTYQIKKDEVLKDLKPKKYHMRYFCLDDLQEDEYYETKELFLFNVVDWRSETIFKLFSALQHITSGKRILSAPEKRMRTEKMYTWENNPRIQCLKRVIEEIGNDKCIIFAKYQDEIKDIKFLLDSMNKTFVEFTGEIRPKQRQQNRIEFKNHVQFMLANKQCGAYGLNLQFCHNIIFYSNDFDLATRLQAEDRVHRIGQEKTVNIYDICCEYTIDVFIANCLQNKSNLLDSFKKQISIWKEAIEMEKIRIRQMNSIKDNDFYNILGYFFASKNFRKKLTYPLSNEDDWIWLVAFNKDNNVIGFLSLEPMASGYKIDSIYVLNDYYKIYGNRVYNELIEKAIKLSKNNKKYISATIKKELVVVFEKYNFYVTKNKSEKWINIRRDLNENIQK
ncbi:MAG: helicase-related protein [Megamonas funiformis]|uniref:helicase-related protein n=1 Tax=Megamonas funiformis TaxID=437897 RepID=UPI0039925134